MASLFDIAAGLSQFDSNSDDGPFAKDDAEIAREEQERGSGRHNCSISESKFNPRVSKTLPSRGPSALCILDETLQTIYDTRRASMTPLSASKSSEQLETRLQQLNGTAKQHAQSFSSSSSELRKVFTHSVSYQQLQQMQTTTSSYSSDAPSSSKPHSSPSNQARGLESGGGPDMIAKTVLREISDEIEQLGSAAMQRSPDDQDSMVRFLTEKYIDARLNKLPGTPLVQLARRKALQKINQLLQYQQRQNLSNDKDTRAQSVNRVAAAAAKASSHHLELQQHPPLGAGAGEQHLWQKIDTLTPQQHEMLRKLTRVPEVQAASLPTAQRELVQFAKRLELLKSMPARELGRLEPHQQQIVRQLQLGHIKTDPC